MRLLCEIFVIGALIYLAWEKPFRDWLPNTSPAVMATPAPAPAPVTKPPIQPQPIVRSTSTPSGEWMWDPAHHSALDRPAYDPREPSKRYRDAQGRNFWYDAKGVRHYDP
jgi:hypothetical protein